MKQVLNYDIYNILKFQIVRDKSYGLRDLINLKFSSFQVDEVDKPDIVLKIGRFTPSNNNCYLIDHKYYVKEDYFYCKDSEGRASWEVEVSGFENRETVINFNKRVSGWQSITNPDLLPQNLLLNLIEYKLSQKGYFLIHSASIAKDNRAYLLAGRGGTFKTTLVMDLIRRIGFDFLSDDRVILNKNGVQGFPILYNIFDYMVQNLVTEESWRIRDKIRVIFHLRKKRHLVNKNAKSTDLKALFFMLKTNAARVKKRVGSSKEAPIRLIANNLFEHFVTLRPFNINSGPWLKYRLAYSFVFPNSPVATYENTSKKNLEEILEGIPVYEIEIPNSYNLDVFSRVHELMGESGIFE